MRKLGAYRGLTIKTSSGPPAPTLLTVTIATNGTTYTLVFSEAVTGMNGGGFSFGLVSGTGSLTYSSGEGTATGVFTAGTAAYSTEPATVSYAPGVVVNAALVALVAITNRTATNGSTVTRSITYNGDVSTTFSTVGKTAIVASCFGGGGAGSSLQGGGGGSISGATTYLLGDPTLFVVSTGGSPAVNDSGNAVASANPGASGADGGGGGSGDFGDDPVAGGSGGNTVGGGGGCGNAASEGNGSSGVEGVSAGNGGAGANGGGNGGNGSLLSNGGNGTAPGGGGGAAAVGTPGTGQPSRITITWNYL